MNIRLKTLFLAFILAACSPSEKEKPKIETQAQEVEDTLQTEKPDGVKVEKPEIAEAAKIAPN